MTHKKCQPTGLGYNVCSPKLGMPDQQLGASKIEAASASKAFIGLYGGYTGMDYVVNGLGINAQGSKDGR